ncbi:hypothetical protein EDF56_11352 [Novosphingobium sp. PhB165]|uniref:DUF1254 domain-containing protein n=1 Tax=Novosphingobium sp. PhB165 TaxID=2485105 RepID=UPI001051EC73|nr:DUF1254 domain-containing protein [Novosphingobium sp. PhB165]TCM14407.1 hypothetical protein EDF56_11352 [Novosphingobium sp. PhB165]
MVDDSASAQAALAIGEDYSIEGGFPTEEAIQKAYDDADLIRAIEAYKFFFPTVSFAGTFSGNAQAGLKPNHGYLLLNGSPSQTVLTPNSDTPYTGAVIDLSGGPMVFEFPPGALMSVVNDANQRYVMDMGVPGPDGGKGGKHIILPPGYEGALPADYFAGESSTNRVLVMVRAIPQGGDVDAAIALLKTVKFYRLGSSENLAALDWIDIGQTYIQFTAFDWENRLEYWRVLHDVVDREPSYEPYRMEYGRLASLGIEKGKPFEPDARMTEILSKAARLANAQMRVQSFADRRADRQAWHDRHWEWAGKRPEQSIWDLPARRDLEAREKWFFQAQVESPAMFRRDEHAGSLYWLGLRDTDGNYVDGGKTYRLRVPLPVPARLFWSVTLYDPETRSEIVTAQGKAALRSLFELRGLEGDSVDLYFAPVAPAGQEDYWLQTLPGKGWFVYFRIYGPERPAFDGSWRPGDFESVD